jgi:hypothetical protein
MWFRSPLQRRLRYSATTPAFSVGFAETADIALQTLTIKLKLDGRILHLAYSIPAKGTMT